MTKEQEMVNKILESLRKNDSLQRKHASFWNFHKKTSKEIGLFSEVFNQFKCDFCQEIVEWGLCKNDPPDIFARLADGSTKGIEITELVNEKAIKLQVRQDPEYSKVLIEFDYEASVNKLHEILEIKEHKLRGRMVEYNGLILLIHTDEFLLHSDLFAGKESHIFPHGSKIFESVYLLFSYEPEKQHSPLLRLI